MRLSSRLRLLAMIPLFALGTASAEEDFYVGTYTKKEGSKGIYHFRLDSETGALSGGELVAETPNPTFLAAHPQGKFIYAANEQGPMGKVSAYAIQADHSLRALNQQSARGDGTCHVSVDAAGKYAFAANYGGGSVAALPIREDGSLGEASAFVQHTGSSANPQRQKEPHAHSIYPDPAGRFVYACDLGTDKIHGYRFDAASGALTADAAATPALAPGSGPRHLAFHPKAAFVYAINELLNTVTVFERDAQTGALRTIQTTSSLPAGYTKSSSCAEIFVHPNGKFVYGSNRGHDSIVAFRIAENGQLALAGHTSTQGKNPRNFAIDPSGKFLLAANQDTDNIVVFQIDGASGALSETGHSVKLGAPVCIVFPPAL